MSNPKTVEPPNGSGSPERPIESFEQDKLERDPFVRRLASALIDRKTGSSRGVVIGITGPWGSGKSSILNLLRERLKADHPQAIVVSFDPWLLSGRNDLISEFINELLATIKSEPKIAKKLKNLTNTITKYGEELEPAVAFFHPTLGRLLNSALGLANKARSRDMSLSTLRKEVCDELAKTSVPIVVLIDELDRIEDHEIRTVAQLVRSVGDFPGISYVLAYDYDRVVQALGEGAAEDKRTERGRAYLEKIVQFQIPLPVTFVDEMSRLLSAELALLQQELRFPENFQDIERYNDLIKLLAAGVIETPRDVKRLVGIFHVLGSMLSQEVEWIDLLAYSALMTKAPGTVNKIRSNPEAFCKILMTFAKAFAEQIEDSELPVAERLSKLIPLGENNEGVRNLIGFLFPSLSARPRSVDEYSDALRLRRPLLTTLRLGLLPGAYSKADILSLVTKEPDEIAQSLRTAYDNNTLGPLIDRLADLHGGLIDIDHVQFWKGVGKFLRKPDCEWMTSYQPIRGFISEFAKMLLLAVKRKEPFKVIASEIFTNLRADNENVLTAHWLRSHISMHGLFGQNRRGNEGAFLTSEQTEAVARDMSNALICRQVEGKLIPCRWDLGPIFMMIETETWGDPCRKQLDGALANDRALDGFTLMLYGADYTTDKATVEKMCSYDAYIKRVTQRLASPTIGDAHQSVQDALRKAKDGGFPTTSTIIPS